MSSRSRSSLVSKIFISHGLWWGDTPVQQQFGGYTTYENTQIKALLKQFKIKYWKETNCREVSPSHNAEFLGQLKTIVPSDRQWMTKIGVEYYNAFADLKPFNIFIKRNPADVVKSLHEKRPDVPYTTALEQVQWRYNYMHFLYSLHGGAFINTDEIINGNFNDLENAFLYCRLPFNPSLAAQCVDNTRIRAR